MSLPVLVIGAGWSGAVVARCLHDSGVPVQVVERSSTVGGHARAEVLNGVLYEPNGAHIFHTQSATVAKFVQRFGITRPYQHRVLTEVYLRDDDADDESLLLSWPPQVEELRSLSDWPLIERELGALPDEPTGEDFESYVVSMMGRSLYHLFIEGYTRKQWGCEPSALSSRFAPRRVELRRDGYTRLFRDAWEFFPKTGVNSAIETILSPVPVTCGAEVTASNLASPIDASAVVVTAPLDSFLDRPGDLAWRGIRMRSTYFPTDTPEGKRTPAYVINRPSPRVPHTRTVETKHASGQLIRGTVVSEELPGAAARHYPLPTAEGIYERLNRDLQTEVTATLAPLPVFYCGRLATYQYINQDQAIEQAFACAQDVIKELNGKAM